MKKIIMLILMLFSLAFIACDNKVQRSYYELVIDCDDNMGAALISGSLNSEGKYTGKVNIEFIANEGFIFNYAIDLYTNDLCYEDTIVIENIDRDYNFQVHFEEDETKVTHIYYESIGEALTGNDLKLALRSLITTTHTYKTTYDDCKKLSYISETDKDPNKPGHILLFWSNISIPCIWDSGATWNREHVWPQSKGWFKESGAGSDLHHIRPTDPSVNTSHGNDPYNVISGGNFVNTSKKNGSVQTQCKKGSGYFEPVDNRKGDTARIIFYLLTRYPESDAYSITQVAYSMDLLLEWNQLDPVDELELNRNEAVYNIQGNRNPFIDDSSYAEEIWG